MGRNELIEQNLRLVHACAHRFKGKGIDYDDLYSAGCVGLVKAVDRFDESLGYKLSTYAVPVILGDITQLFRSGGSVKLSRSLQELSARARDLCDRCKTERGEEMKITELAEKLGVDVYRATEALNAAQTVVSLSGDTEEGGIEIPVPSPEDALTERLSLKQAMSALNEEEKGLIELRYFRHKTQQETAETLGTTQVQISRREKKILMKMRSMLL
ncbi:MAG: sigma-70 family RNA polymerase sigma factor [Ruminococcus sp.]|nr:sigma-70 family RNA polymerase sigma factor [Ruminococcus sp.]